MSIVQLRGDFIGTIERAFRGRTNQEALTAMLKRVERMTEDPVSITDTIRRVEVATRLLVDEELADDLSTTLASIANIEARIAGHSVSVGGAPKSKDGDVIDAEFEENKV